MRKSIYFIGTRVKERRKEKCWTQRDLAQRVGTSYKYISHVENGIKFPSLEMLVCLARELEVSLDYLVGAELLSQSQKEMDMVQELWPDCSPEEHAFMVELIQFVQLGMKKHGIVLE